MPMRKLLEPGRRRSAVLAYHRQLDEWANNGFLVLPGLFGQDQIAAADLFDEAWATKNERDPSMVVDAYAVEPARQYLRDVPDHARNHPYKINDLFLESEAVRSLVLDERLLAWLRTLAGDEVVAINSLHFERGSTQGYHVDTFFMPPPPGGTLIVSSICLEDVHPQAGPLGYFPGSHRIAPWLNCDGDRRARSPGELEAGIQYMQARVSALSLQPQLFLGHGGDTFLWHEQLFHSGTPIVDISRTRKSIVTHYWTKSCMGGWDVQPHGSGWYLRRPPAEVTSDG